MVGGAADIELLRAELLALQAEVIRLRARVSALEADRFELVEGEDPPAAAASSPVASPLPPAASSTLSREEVCKRVGEFLRRCLEGKHRGSSSRDLLGLASRFWIVVRTFDGQVHDPPRVFSKFGSCKPLVKRGSDVRTRGSTAGPSSSTITKRPTKSILWVLLRLRAPRARRPRCSRLSLCARSRTGRWLQCLRWLGTGEQDSGDFLQDPLCEPRLLKLRRPGGLLDPSGRPTPV